MSDYTRNFVASKKDMINNELFAGSRRLAQRVDVKGSHRIGSASGCCPGGSEEQSWEHAASRSDAKDQRQRLRSFTVAG